ncbi:hypothetical protein Sjap_010841 [Stephania japonica]|uniref:Nuclear nucleic acid-binding protein C1D n=1 Tax=Stephania japonica TaxID=461633 RepID=A0AAP0JAD6_9MAGN
MGRRENEDSPIPEAATVAVNATLANIDNVRFQLNKFMSISDADVLAQMGPLERAKLFLVLARTVSTLVALKLRCSGICPFDHPVQKELERLKLYQKKLDQCIGLSKEPLRPSVALNHQAATRFIEHSLHDLTAEQKQNMSISRGDAVKSRFVEHKDTQNRQKRQSNEKQSVEAANEEFLQKVARDIFGPSRTSSNVKDPLRLKTTAVDEKME